MMGAARSLCTDAWMTRLTTTMRVRLLMMGAASTAQPLVHLQLQLSLQALWQALLLRQLRHHLRRLRHRHRRHLMLMAMVMVAATMGVHPPRLVIWRGVARTTQCLAALMRRLTTMARVRQRMMGAACGAHLLRQGLLGLVVVEFHLLLALRLLRVVVEAAGPAWLVLVLVIM